MADTLGRFTFGRNILGPVISAYLLRLHQTIDYFERERQGKVLFVSRAGIRIHALYQLFCDVTHLPPTSGAEIFWISRLLTAKGIFQACPDLAIQLFQKEFAYSTLGEAVVALLRDVKPSESLNISALQQPADQLPAFLSSKHRTARLLREHLTEQSALFDSYVGELIGDAPVVLLVDTGWQETAQKLLTKWRPDIDWWGAYIGRFGFPETDRSIWPQMLGLLFEADDYVPETPETCLRLHRHLIEQMLEPNGRSVETLTAVNGKTRAIGDTQILADAPTPECDPIFCGVRTFLCGPMADSPTPASIMRAAQDAWPKLAKMLATPSKHEARLLGDGKRSADFGRDLRVPILLHPEDRHDGDHAELRISQSLWPQGQIALEYPDHIAFKAQCQTFTKECDPIVITQRPRQRAQGKIQLLLERAEWMQNGVPKVAVITRTMDRPLMLKRALHSIAQQTFEEYEQIVVCDGGPIEPIIEAIEESDADPRKVRLIDNITNRGMEAASNIAIQRSTSDYLLIHDDDDTLEPDFLQETVRFLEDKNAEKYGAVVTQSTYVSEEIIGDTIHEHRRSSFNEWMTRVYIEEMILGNFFPPIAFVFRRSLYDEVGGFSQDLPVLGDWDFNLRVLERADIGVIPQALSNYHHRDIGNATIYGNSVVAGNDKHAAYDAIVRNRYIRGHLGQETTSISAAIAQSLILSEIKKHVRNTASSIQSSTALSANGVSLQQQNAMLKKELEALLTSTSWRITSPIRSLKKLLNSLGYYRSRIALWLYWTLSLQLRGKLRERAEARRALRS